MAADLRALVASPHWRWMPGMRVQRDGLYWGRVVALDQRASTELRVCWENGTFWMPQPAEWAAYLPDLSDPATLGCLLALVREAWAGFGVTISDENYDGPECEVVVANDDACHYFDGATEGECLAAALLAAPDTEDDEPEAEPDHGAFGVECAYCHGRDFDDHGDCRRCGGTS